VMLNIVTLYYSIHLRLRKLGMYGIKVEET